MSSPSIADIAVVGGPIGPPTTFSVSLGIRHPLFFTRAWLHALYRDG